MYAWIMFSLFCSFSTEDKPYSRISSWTCTQLFHILCHKDPGPIQHWFLIYISFPFTVHMVVESVLVSLRIPCQIQSQVDLYFPNPSLNNQAAALSSSWITCYCLHLLYILFQCPCSVRTPCLCCPPAAFALFPTSWNGLF